MPNPIKLEKNPRPTGRFGRYWWIVYSLTALIAGLVFSCVPVLIMQTPVELPPAYLLKSQNPFADTAALTIPEHPGERSHGAKLTPRIVGSIGLWGTSRLGLHPYWPASIGGVVFLICGVVTTFRLTGDRLTSLAAGCLFAGLYSLNGCLSLNGDPKPFDGVAVGMISLAILAIDRPILLWATAFLACWTDERALLACVHLCFLLFVSDRFSKEIKKRGYYAVSTAALAYGITRLVAAFALGWTKPDTSLLGGNPVYSLGLAQLTGWICFEGAWLLLVSAVASRAPQLTKVERAALATLVIVSIGSCLVVLDISRATMFCFPLVFAALAMLTRTADGTNGFLRRLTASAACVSLLAGNVDFIAGIAYTPLPSLSMFQWLRLFSPSP